MNPLIVADESVDFAIIQCLRDSGFSVLAIFEEHPGWPDAEVLEKSNLRIKPLNLISQ